MPEENLWTERNEERVIEAVLLVKLLEPSADLSVQHLKLPEFSWPCNRACCRGKDPAWPAAGEQWQSWWPATCTGCRLSVLWLWRELGTTEGWCRGGWKDKKTQMFSNILCSLSKLNWNGDYWDRDGHRGRDKTEIQFTVFSELKVETDKF